MHDFQLVPAWIWCTSKICLKRAMAEISFPTSISVEANISTNQIFKWASLLCLAQDKSDRLLVMYPDTLIFLSEENDRLFYKVGYLVTSANLQAWTHSFLRIYIAFAGSVSDIIALYCRGNFPWIWSQSPRPVKRSSPTRSWSKVSQLMVISTKYSEEGKFQVIKRNQDDVFCRSICFLKCDVKLYFGCSELPHFLLWDFEAATWPSLLLLSLPGKLINPIIVSCPDKMEFHEWIQHFKAADVPILSPPPPVYDIIYTPTQKEVQYNTQTPYVTLPFCSLSLFLYPSFSLMRSLLVICLKHVRGGVMILPIQDRVHSVITRLQSSTGGATPAPAVAHLKCWGCHTAVAAPTSCRFPAERIIPCPPVTRSLSVWV